MKVTNGLSAHIRKQRLRRGWTQAELAEQVGKSRPTISNLENGNTKLVQDGTITAIFNVFMDSIPEVKERLSFEEDAWSLVRDRVESCAPLVESGQLDPGGALFLCWAPVEAMAEERGVLPLDEINKLAENMLWREPDEATK